MCQCFTKCWNFLVKGQSLVMEIYSKHRISSSCLKPWNPLEKPSDLSVTEHCNVNGGNKRFKLFLMERQMFTLMATVNAASVFLCPHMLQYKVSIRQEWFEGYQKAALLILSWLKQLHPSLGVISPGLWGMCMNYRWPLMTAAQPLVSLVSLNFSWM